MRVHRLVGAVLIASLAIAAHAQVVFNFDSGTAGTDLDELVSGSTTSGGITLTATGFPSGTFNVTGSGFGYNATGGTDDTDEFDPNEGFTFSFSTDVILVSISVSQFGAGTSAGTIAFDGGSTFASITATGSTSLQNTLVNSGTVLRFTSTGSTPFSVDSITVSAIPEPSTYAALFGVAALGGVMWHRRRKAKAAA